MVFKPQMHIVINKKRGKINFLHSHSMLIRFIG